MKKILLLSFGFYTPTFLFAQAPAAVEWKKEQNKTEIGASASYFSAPVLNEAKHLVVGQFILVDGEGNVRAGVGPGIELGHVKMGGIIAFHNVSENPISGGLWLIAEPKRENYEFSFLVLGTAKEIWTKGALWFNVKKEGPCFSAGIYNEGKNIGVGVRCKVHHLSFVAAGCDNYNEPDKKSILFGIEAE